MHIHIDTLGGMAGDMFCAALLDAFPQYYSELQTVIQALAPPETVTLALHEHQGVLRGKQFIVQGAEHTPQHGHTHYRDICHLLTHAPLAPAVRTRAQTIFHFLAQAEAHVHRVSLDEVTFHEVGNWDSLLDIVSAAFLLERCGVESASLSPLPLGGGRISSAHGFLPVPAPATARLLHGFVMRDDGIGGERVTPTGAAILKSLNPMPRLPDNLSLCHDGCGFGTRILAAGVPNCVRVLLFSPLSSQKGVETITVLRFDIDDQSGEDLALALDQLRAHAGVISVISLHAIGKHGRCVQQIEILTRRDVLERVLDACFRTTTTLGIRWHEQQRQVLERYATTVALDGQCLHVKLARRPDGVSAKVENRDMRTCTSHNLRQALRSSGAQAAITAHPNPWPDDDHDG
jgi:pyridinium-3,5-bisthiocarboxylic acid mononucleotide nickel chelatase